MRRGAVTALAIGVLLGLVGPAAGATPPQIYKDLADNGRLDRHYSKADIDRALHAPSLEGYERPVPVRRPSGAVPAASSAADARGPLPFSGLDLALLGGVGAPLLLLGATMGRLTRVRAGERV
ncbi:MAG TPA: hypothetical protein VGQ68_01580 [Gaiellaceae bacterium]|jgi:hypothetical protein|nr:hypothetical protein [Gaiellaceae bacterium]